MVCTFESELTRQAVWKKSPAFGSAELEATSFD